MCLWEAILKDKILILLILFQLLNFHLWQAANCTLHTAQCTLRTVPANENALENASVRFMCVGLPSSRKGDWKPRAPREDRKAAQHQFKSAAHSLSSRTVIVFGPESRLPKSSHQGRCQQQGDSSDTTSRPLEASHQGICHWKRCRTSGYQPDPKKRESRIKTTRRLSSRHQERLAIVSRTRGSSTPSTTPLSLRSSLQPRSQHQPPWALADEEATSHTIFKSFLRPRSSSCGDQKSTGRYTAALRCTCEQGRLSPCERETRSSWEEETLLWCEKAI